MYKKTTFIILLIFLLTEPVWGMDLKPSFERSLPYVKVCGVIVVQADFPLTEIEACMRDIEELQYDLTRYIGIPAPQEKIELCLFKNEKTYIAFLKKEFTNAPMDRPALFVKKDGPGILMVQRGPNLEVDLRHEMTHAILHASLRDIPIWLDEGLAKYYELPPGKRAFGNEYLKSVRASTRRNIVPSLARLESLRTISEMGQQEYRDAWAWTHFLIHRSSETHHLLADYLQSLGKQPPHKNGGPFSKKSPGTATTKFPLLEPQLKEKIGSIRTDFIEHYRVWQPTR